MDARSEFAMNAYTSLAAAEAHTPAKTSAEGLGNIVHNRRIRVDEQSARIPLPGITPPADPRVELVREGGVVKSIIVRCSCGRGTQLVCDYE
jgi:hypothetical protein